MKSIAPYIDHTLLKPSASQHDILKLIHEAIEYNFACVCIPPIYVTLANQLLQEHQTIKVCTVIGFPLGYNLSKVKVYEAQQAVLQGADEIDMVVNQNFIKNEDWNGVEEDIKSIRAVSKNKVLKVILETAHLTDEEIIKASKIAEKSGANFIKTSTGFGKGGASIKAVKLMKSVISANMKIKASGGIRDLATAQKYIDLGVSRIGTSSGVSIIKGQTSTTDY